MRVAPEEPENRRTPEQPVSGHSKGQRTNLMAAVETERSFVHSNTGTLKPLEQSTPYGLKTNLLGCLLDRASY